MFAERYHYTPEQLFDLTLGQFIGFIEHLRKESGSTSREISWDEAAHLSSVYRIMHGRTER